MLSLVSALKITRGSGGPALSSSLHPVFFLSRTQGCWLGWGPFQKGQSLSCPCMPLSMVSWASVPLSPRVSKCLNPLSYDTRVFGAGSASLSLMMALSNWVSSCLREGNVYLVGA